MFYGEYEHTMDEKGRIFLPARHRVELGPVVVLGRGMDGQVNVYPKAHWEQMVNRLGQTTRNRVLIRYARRFLNSASECEVDRQGRILVPPPLRRHGKLDTNVVIIGNGNRVEIWSPDRLQDASERMRELSQQEGDKGGEAEEFEWDL